MSDGAETARPAGALGVVPAKAGTHTPRPFSQAMGPTPSLRNPHWSPWAAAFAATANTTALSRARRTAKLRPCGLGELFVKLLVNWRERASRLRRARDRLP